MYLTWSQDDDSPPDLSIGCSHRDHLFVCFPVLLPVVGAASLSLCVLFPRPPAVDDRPPFCRLLVCRPLLGDEAVDLPVILIPCPLLTRRRSSPPRTTYFSEQHKHRMRQTADSRSLTRSHLTDTRTSRGQVSDHMTHQLPVVRFLSQVLTTATHPQTPLTLTRLQNDAKNSGNHLSQALNYLFSRDYDESDAGRRRGEGQQAVCKKASLRLHTNRESDERQDVESVSHSGHHST